MSEMEDRNLAAYERVYAKCVASAQRLREKELNLDVQQVASELFSRFWEDQIEIVKSKISAGPQAAIAEMLEGRLGHL